MNIADSVLAAGAADAIALIAAERRVSYAALRTMVNRCANGLKDHGVVPGDRVMMQMADSPELIAAYLGAMRLGAVAVAVNTFWSAEELRHALRDSGARVMLADPSLAGRARAAASGLDAAPEIVIVDRETFANADDTPITADRAAGDSTLWIYTSGTTGRPKAAMHSHVGLLIPTDYFEKAIGLRRDDRVLITSKMFFAYSAGHGVFGALRLGATLILHAPWPDAAAVVDLIRAHRPTVLFSVPSLYGRVLQELGDGTRSFDSLRTCLSAGEKLPLPIFEAWRTRTGLEIREGIGATETMYLFLINREGASRPGSVGRPAPGTRLRLVDTDGHAITASGEIGVLWVNCPSLCTAYWNRDDLTVDAFDEDWYRTGDLFRVDTDNNWYHEGRADDLMKISGQWLNPHEIEACVLEDNATAEVAVVGAPGENGLDRIVLFAAGIDTPRRPAFERMVRDRVPAKLGRHKLPREIRFVDSLPRTATGKVQRHILRTMMRADG